LVSVPKSARDAGMARMLRGFIPENETQVKEAVDNAPQT
jgi:hypothetical protein